MMRLAEEAPLLSFRPREGAMPKRWFSIRPTWSLRGRRFQGLRGFTGKPTHPPLTDFPIVCYTLAAIFDVISYFASDYGAKAHDFFVSATYVMTAGFIVSLGTALTGFMDYWKGIPRDRSTGPIGKAKRTQAWRTINWHATVMLTVTAITIVDLALRLPDFDKHGQTEPLWLVLSVVAGLLVLFGAAYGGTLVFDYGFNVMNVKEVWEESEEDYVPPDRKRPSS
jgi:uncharacterized membrane protein